MVYIIATTLILVALKMIPHADDTFVYAVFPEDVPFTKIAHIAYNADASLVQDGALENAFIFHSEEKGLHNRLKAHGASWVFNPIFLKPCAPEETFLR